MKFREKHWDDKGPEYEINLAHILKNPPIMEQMRSKKVREFIDSVFKYTGYIIFSSIFLKFSIAGFINIILPIILYFLSLIYLASLLQATYIHVSNKHNVLNAGSNLLALVVLVTVPSWFGWNVIAMMASQGGVK
ncbi:hypothetical protein [Rhabdaerophilum sp.]|uniref:hypothetical protein n=1 Tax=Rhabdaerophilum sp. TaxID=2717341 RepID=UPI0038D3C76C